MKTSHLLNKKGVAGPIMAATVLLVGIVAALSLSNTGVRFKVLGSKKEAANDLAQKKLEQILNQPWTTDSDGSQDNVSWTITSQGASGRLKKISVTVTGAGVENTGKNDFTVVGYKYNDF